jgi:outer membrane receptor protein involved in Fe transport
MGRPALQQETGVIMGHMHVRAIVRQLVWSAASVLATGSVVAAEDVTEDELEQVVVTGSRLAPSGFSTPTPVTVLGADVIEELGINNIGAGANQLPAFRATTTPTTNGWGSFNVGAQIVNLRGLGVTRNLVLVDSRRFAPVTREGTVDLNLVPSGLVERLEVVTGGASAAYGSDAVAGAVNVILNKDLTGIKAQADYGLAEEGDGQNYHLALAGGADFAGGRGHFILGGEFAKQDGIGDCFTRSYCEPGAVVSNTGAGAVAGLPALYRVSDRGGFIANPRGVITVLNNNGAPGAAVVSVPTATSIRNLLGTGAITFDAAGNPVAYRLGLPASGSTGVGPDTTASFTTAQLEVPVERYATFGHAYFDFTDNVQGFIEGSYGHVDGSVMQSRYFGAAIPIYADNPFIPAAVRALLPAASATPSATRPTTANFNLAVLGQRRGHSASEADAMRATTGLKVTINDNWRWDAYYQYAHTDRFQSVEDNLVTGASRVINRPGSGGVNNPASYAFWSWANDPVYNPADAALPAAQRRIVCRATISADAALRAAASDCVPFNPFGEQASTAALDYVYRTLTEDIHIAQHVVAANLQGTVAELWAGPLSIATGLEYRHDSTSLQHDPLSNSFAYFQNFGADYNASQDVVEGYLETELPLLRDQPFARALSLNGAIRRTKYDIEGFGSYNQAAAANKFNATTWKLGMVWEPLDWMRLRFTTSRDIRAPNFNELFQASASTFGSVVNRFVAGAPSQFPVALTGGNPALGPETGRTTTMGLVMQPQFIEGLSLSLDYYRIKVKDYIGTPGGTQNIVDRCANFNDTLLCPLITFGAGQSLSEIRNVNVNLQWLRTSGLDVEAVYRLPLANISELPGTLNFRLLASRTYELATNLFGVVTDRAGEVGGLGGSPSWLGTLNTGYSNGAFNATLTTRYIRGGKFNAQNYEPGQSPPIPSAVTINDNTVGGIVYFNLNTSWKFSDKTGTELFMQVNNLADRSPPLAPQLQYPSNPVFYDLIGRSYRFGVRMKF